MFVVGVTFTVPNFPSAALVRLLELKVMPLVFEERVSLAPATPLPAVFILEKSNVTGSIFFVRETVIWISLCAFS